MLTREPWSALPLRVTLFSTLAINAWNEARRRGTQIRTDAAMKRWEREGKTMDEREEERKERGKDERRVSTRMSGVDGQRGTDGRRGANAAGTAMELEDGESNARIH